MALPMGHLISGALGLAMGAAITVWSTKPQPSEPMTTSASAVSRSEIEAAIATDPSLCGPAESEPPTAEEAQAAFLKAKGTTFPKVTITIGQCDRDTMGPGVACMSRIVWGPGGEPAERLVGFARSPDGWVATLY
jgi:hypothetical protein